jgi:predicted secreted protein
MYVLVYQGKTHPFIKTAVENRRTYRTVGQKLTRSIDKNKKKLDIANNDKFEKQN